MATEVETQTSEIVNENQEQAIDVAQTDVEQEQSAAPGVIDVADMEANVPEIPDAPSSNVDGVVDGGLSAAETFLATQTQQRQEKAELDKELAKSAGRSRLLEERIGNLSGIASTRGRATIEAERASGLNRQQDELNDIMGNIASLTNTIKKRQVKDELDVKRLADQMRGVPIRVVRGRQALLAAERRADRKMDALDLESMTAVANLMQNNISQARESIDRMIDLEFGDVEKQLETELFFLDRVDTKEARQRKEKLEKEKQEMELLKDERNSVFSIAESASSNGAPSSLVTQITKAKTREEAVALAGRYGVSISDRIAQAKRADEVAKLQAELNISGDKAESMAEQIKAARALGDFMIKGGRGQDINILDQIIGNTKAQIQLTRGTGEIRSQAQDYISGVENMLDTLTLNTFAEAKEKGMTFGAMSEGEWEILAATASRLTKRRIKNKKGDVIGYSGSQDGFKEDISSIIEGAEKSYQRTTGEAFPEEYTVDESGNMVIPVEQSNEEFFGE